MAARKIVFQIGVEPIRIDVLTAIDGVDFEQAWAESSFLTVQELETFVLSRAKLIQNKRAAGRDQDLVDVRWLTQHSGES